MSSSTDYMTYLSSIEKKLYAYGGPITIILGTICCAINLLIFCQKKLRTNPCAIYLISVNISNLLFIYTSILFVTLSVGYGIDLSSHNIVGCRVIYYCSLLFDCLSSFYLILASIDRALVTSQSARTRQRSSLGLAYKCLLIGTLFWMLFHIHTFFLIDIQELSPGYVTCYFRAGPYSDFIGYYSTIIKGILMIVLLIIFGLMTCRNLARVNHHTVVPSAQTDVNSTGNHENITRSKNRQFALMLLVETLIYITFNSMLAIIGVYQQIAKDQSQTPFTYFIRLIGAFVSYTPLCANFVGNLIISKAFRSEVKRIFFIK